jgi:integrase
VNPRHRTGRRANREGSRPRQRADGRWQTNILLPDGRRTSVYGRTREELSQALLDLRQSLARGAMPAPNARLTIGPYLDNWVEETVQYSRRLRTYRRYRSVVDTHLIPALGHIRLGQLSRQDVLKLQSDLAARGLARNTILLVRNTLSAALEAALKDDIIVRNVVALTDPPAGQHVERPVLSHEQCAAWLRVCATDELRGGMFAIMLLTGLRIGEAQGLRWSDVAPDYRSFRVNQQLLEGDGKPYSFGEPKSQGGRRDVPLSSDAVRVLRDQRQRVVARRLLLGSRWQDMDLVFPGETGACGSGADGARSRYQAIPRRAAG